MNAINFIKQHGVEKAREVIEGAPDRATTVKPSLDFKHFMYGICEEAGGAYILLSDLKRLIESVDMVKEYGGISMAKRQCACFTNACTSVGVKPSPRLSALQQAIADYESIYGGEHV